MTKILEKGEQLDESGCPDGRIRCKTCFLRDGERLDDLGGGRKIIQHPEKYCFTSDAAALANCIKANSGDTVIDLGTGSGIISILTALQTKAKKIIGIEIQPDMADMARRSVEMNGLSDRVQIDTLKIQDAATALKNERVTVVAVNPPYRKKGAGDSSENPSVAISRSEVAVTLSEVIECAGKLLQTGGRFYMVHQSERLAEIIFLMKQNRIEPKVLRFLTPQTIIVEGLKDGKECMLCYI